MLAIVYSDYCVQDGLTGWVSAGLPLSDESDYDSGPIAEISGVVEGRILPFLRWTSLKPEEIFHRLPFKTQISFNFYKRLSFLNIAKIVMLQLS